MILEFNVENILLCLVESQVKHKLEKNYCN